MNVLWTSYELLLPADLDVFPCMRSLKFDAAMLLRYTVPCMHNAKFNVAIYTVSFRIHVFTLNLACHLHVALH